MLGPETARGAGRRTRPAPSVAAIVAATALLFTACGPGGAVGGSDAATAAARVKGGVEAQGAGVVATVQAAATGAAPQVNAAVATGQAAASQVPAAVGTQVPGAVATVQAVATQQGPGVASTVQAAATQQGPGLASTVQAAATQQGPGIAATAQAAATQQAPGAASTAQALATQQGPGAVSTVQSAATQVTGAQPAGVATAAVGALGGLAQMTPEEIGTRARAEAARLLGVPPEQLTVERVEPVQWSDSSLGCREPNRSYAQVITPGFRIVLSGGGQRREVHTDLAGRMVVCQSPTQ